MGVYLSSQLWLQGSETTFGAPSLVLSEVQLGSTAGFKSQARGEDLLLDLLPGKARSPIDSASAGPDQTCAAPFLPVPRCPPLPLLLVARGASAAGLLPCCHAGH